MTRWMRRLLDLWGDHPGIDWFIALAFTAAHATVAGDHLLAQHSLDQRLSIYSAVAAVAAIIGGFGTAAITQYATNSGRRMTFLRLRFGLSLRRNWVSILTSMAAVSGFSLLAMIVDHGDQVGEMAWLLHGVLVAGVVRTIRLIWLFRLLIDVVDHDGINSGSDQPIRVTDHSRVPPTE